MEESQTPLHDEMQRQLQQPKVAPQVVRTREQKGHSLTLHLLISPVLLFVNLIYISASPNHYWHA